MPALTPGIMGILNCTPDSFSDGGRWQAGGAVAAGIGMVAAGAAWLDVGGESSRPGAQPVPATEELARVVPVLRGLRAAGVTVPISIDTVKAEVAAEALAAGATAINDISAGEDPGMFPLAAAHGCQLILMHRQGAPSTMQRAPRYVEVVREVGDHLAARVAAAEAAGIARTRLYVDPGIGFGKTVAHNLDLLRGLPELSRRLALPLVVGISRKRFLAAVSGTPYPAADALAQPMHVLIAPWCALLRVHDVAGTMHALRTAAAGAPAGAPDGRLA
jgi:dihydropteroate synthase